MNPLDSNTDPAVLHRADFFFQSGEMPRDRIVLDPGMLLEATALRVEDSSRLRVRILGATYPALLKQMNPEKTAGAVFRIEPGEIVACDTGREGESYWSLFCIGKEELSVEKAL